MTAPHPRDVLFEDGDPTAVLPVCDHYAGVEARMRKSLELQGELGPVFNVTLDGEDGAPVGGELEHAQLIGELIDSPANRFGRVGARVLPVDHPRFAAMVDIIVRDAASCRDVFVYFKHEESGKGPEFARLLMDHLGV